MKTNVHLFSYKGKIYMRVTDGGSIEWTTKKGKVIEEVNYGRTQRDFNFEEELEKAFQDYNKQPHE